MTAPAFVPANLILDGQEDRAERSPFEVMPYGMWTTADGTEVLFNRGYEPFLRRKAGKVEVCEPYWVEDIVRSIHFRSGDPTLNTRRLADMAKVLGYFLTGLPIPAGLYWVSTWNKTMRPEHKR